MRSNISITLNKRRKKNLFRKVSIFSSIILVLIVSFLFCLNTESMKINIITVSGNSSISSEVITEIAKGVMKEKILWLIPTDNMFFLKSRTIKNQLLAELKVVKGTDIKYTGFNSIDISVIERSQLALWCEGGASLSENCYSLDEDGYIYEKTSGLNASSTEKYFGLIDGDPINKNYFSCSKFKEVYKLYKGLEEIGLNPKSFNAVNEHDYEVSFAKNGKIIFNDKKTFENILINLQSVINNGDIKTDSESLNKIKNIDLRYGNKVIIS